jgi:DNA-binding PadR family transcriptional regulator
LKPVDLILLLALAEGDRHGYALSQEVERRTEGGVRLEAGNLYRTLRRLVGEGLVGEAGRRLMDEGDDERRNYLRITPLGLRAVQAEVKRLRALLASPSVKALGQRAEPT